MTGARTTTLARLKGVIDRLESGVDATLNATFADRVALGHAEADAALQGGLKRGAFHEIFAGDGAQGASVTGFALGLAQRLVAAKGHVLWVRQDFVAREQGELSMSGFAELGFDPRRLVVVRAHNADVALRVMADGLACNALGVVIGEVWGETKSFDLPASRKLTLGAGQSGVTALMLRIAAQPQASTAETRWIVRAARSPPETDDADAPWGAPVFDTDLVRNRHGPCGRWIMEWKCDESRFSEQTAHPQPLAAAPADRPHPAPARGASDQRYAGARA